MTRGHGSRLLGSPFAERRQSKTCIRLTGQWPAPVDQRLAALADENRRLKRALERAKHDLEWFEENTDSEVKFWKAKARVYHHLVTQQHSDKLRFVDFARAGQPAPIMA